MMLLGRKGPAAVRGLRIRRKIMKKLGFGLMRLPLLDADNPKKIDRETVYQMADLFLEQGFSYFDTAYPYHEGISEIAFREAVVKRHPRNAYTITDKLPLYLLRKEDEMEQIFRQQLERLGLDFIDYYWLHNVGTASYATAKRLGAFEFVRRKKEQGMVGHIGFSFHDRADLLDRVLTEHPEMEFVQLQLNYLDWEDANVQARLCYETAVRHGKRVMVMEPVKGGTLASLPPKAMERLEKYRPGLSPAGWALLFAASRKAVVTVLSGMSDRRQMEENLSVMENQPPLTADEEQALLQVAELLRAKIAVPCTACRYCVAGCPKHIAIPDYFSLYNNLCRFGSEQWGNVNAYYGNLTQNHGKASDCVGCGACEAHCPQHLPIREHLRRVAEALEQGGN